MQRARGNPLRVATEANKIAKRANVIAIWGIVVSTLLFILTLATFWITKRSVDISESALVESQRRNTIDSAERSHDRLLDSITTSKRFRIDSASLQGQINTLEEAKRSFELENRPFITMDDIRLDTSFPNGSLEFFVAVRNVGKFPAKVLLMRGRVGIGADTTHLLRNIPLPTTHTNQYLGNNAIIPLIGGISNVGDLKSQFLTGQLSFFLFGTVEYQPFTATKTYRRNFVYRLNYDPRLSVMAIVNEEK